MAQMRAAFTAHGFYTGHAVTGVPMLGNSIFVGRRVKAGPTAARIKFGVGFKQLRAAAHAVVAAVLPMGFILTRERALGGSFARDLEGHGLCMFGGEQFAPFLFGFLNLHDEQLISMDEAHSGARPAQAS